ASLPMSYIFPYTTLFRSQEGPLHRPSRPRPGVDAARGCAGPGRLADRGHAARLLQGFEVSAAGDRCDRDDREVMVRRLRRSAGRSEEHTSELQSLAYLVC